MSDTQQKQYDRFVEAGYEPDFAAHLVELGAWLGTKDVSPRTVADINRYRSERDARAEERHADVGQGTDAGRRS